MDTINWRRLAVAGVLAGAILILLAIACTTLLVGHKGLLTSLQALLPVGHRVASSLFFLGGFLLIGLFAIWLYAAIRPRFGAGPKTAAIAGLSVWLIGVGAQIVKAAALNDVSNLPSGPLLPLLYLVVIIASTEAGALLYSE